MFKWIGYVAALFIAIYCGGYRTSTSGAHRTFHTIHLFSTQILFNHMLLVIATKARQFDCTIALGA